MNEPLTGPIGRNWIFWILLAMVIIAGFWLRIAFLEADPPMYFDGYGQSLSTDPYQYTFHARNKILFGESDPLNVDQWKVFEFTLVSGLSYLLFLIFGISRLNANLAGVLLSFSAIILFLISIKKIAGLKGTLIAAVFLLLNKVLFIYGRLPYLENGLLFWLAILFFVFVYFRQSLWGKIVIGILIALAGFTGKIFGFICLAPVIGAFWFEDRRKIWKNIGIIVLSFLGAAILWLLFAYGSKIELITQYLFQQTIGLYGFPDALKSPLTFFEKLINFGNDSLFYILAPALGVTGFMAFVIMLRPDRKINLNVYVPVIFLAIWFIAGQLFLMLGNYRPLRYEFMLYFPLAGLAGFVFINNFETGRANGKLFLILHSVFLFLIIWIFLEQTVYAILRAIGFSETYEEKAAQTAWITLAPAVIVTLLETKFHRLADILSMKSAKMIIVTVLLIAGVVDFGRDYLLWQEQKSFNIKESGQDLGQILGKNAVITGPMAPTLLLENNLRGMIYAVGISEADTGLFKKFPATHFAIDVASAQIVIDEFPQLDKAKLIADYWVRDTDVGIYKIWGATGNVPAEQYVSTDYEIGCKFMESEQYDSAQFYIEKFLDQYPANKSALKLLSDIYSFHGDIAAGLGAIRTACGLYPNDFSLLSSEAAICQKIFVATGDKQYQAVALRDFRKVLKMNPYQADEIEAITRQIANFKSDDLKTQ